MGILIGFLKENEISLCGGQEFDDAPEVQAAVDVPIHHAKGAWPTREPAAWSKTARLKFLQKVHALIDPYRLQSTGLCGSEKCPANQSWPKAKCGAAECVAAGWKRRRKARQEYNATGQTTFAPTTQSQKATFMMLNNAKTTSE